jgi:uncharacterized alkaline shock family protein YloU
MSEQIIVTAYIIIEFDTKAPKKLRLKEIGEVVQSAVSECSQIENAASVQVDGVRII